MCHVIARRVLFPTKQSPDRTGDCLPFGYDVAKGARNDILGAKR